MGAASRTPARCSCGAVGPLRGKPAADAGWTKIDGAWTCPACRPQVQRERDAEFEAQVEAAERRLFRACPLIFMAPLLLTAPDRGER